MNSIPVEIERKFVILMPDVTLLEKMPGYTKSEITQIYISSLPGVTHRVRKREYSETTVYTETKKIRIDSTSAYEDDREISEEEYLSISENIKKDTSPIKKVRRTAVYKGKTLEIDIYPNWNKTAILEVELSDREEYFDLPEFIKVILEVTGDKKYSNASMAISFPRELI